MATKDTDETRIGQNYSHADRWFKERFDIGLSKALVVYALLGAYLAVFFFPVVWMFAKTVSVEGSFFTKNLLPALNSLTLENYIEVLEVPEFRRYLWNSTVIATGTTTISLALGIPAAYSLSRFEYRGQNLMILFYLSIRMLPPVLFLIPFYALVFDLGLVDDYLGIIAAHSVIALPLVVWLMKGYFDDIPDSIDNAALVDGCNHFDVMARIMIPMSKPGIAVAGFWAFVTSWNDFLFASIIAQSDATRPVTVGLQLFMGRYNIEWNLLLAAAAVMVIPVLVLFFLIQGWVVEGIKGTGGGGGGTV